MKADWRGRRVGMVVALALLAGSSTGIVADGVGVPYMGRALAAAPGGEDAAEATVPLRRIILYRSGVGAFERQGTVSGTKTVSMKFETDQINDILMSMVLLDLDGGNIGAVTYASKEPLARRLASFGVDISGDPSIGDLFKQLRGAKVTVDAAEGQMTGTVLGVEPRVTPVPDSQSGGITEPYLNVVTGTGVRSVAVSGIRSFTFDDEELAKELNLALAALADHRTDRIKTVDLKFSGPGGAGGNPRRVVVSYVLEMPVWKTSYRLVLPDSGTHTDPTLQGWAIVENTTDDDWSNVELSLASGRPVSFTMDLYEPLFAPRPEVPVPFLAGVMPRVYEAGRQLMKATQGAGMADMTEGARRINAFGRVASAEAAGAPQAPSMPPTVSADEMARYAAAAQASAGEIGEQFMYTVDQPVTLERQRSAMLPILSSSISGRRVSIYNPAQMASNPMRGVELTNDTDLQLIAGPISVYDGAAYAGDAQIPNTSRGQHQLMSYAVDLDVKGSVETKSNETIDAIKIVNGVVQHKVTRRASKIYTLTNNDQKRDRTVLVEHQRNAGWDLIEPAKPYEKTDSLYRFELEVPAAKEASLTVTEQKVLSYTFEIGTYGLERVTRYLRRGKMSKQVADAITKAMEIQSEIGKLQEQIRQLDAERNSIDQDQSRVRSNMQSIDRNSDLYARYMKKLGDQETRLEQIAKERAQAQSQLDDKKQELANFVKNLNVK